MPRLEGSQGRRGRCTRCESEKEKARIELPEAATAHKHVGPAAGVACLDGLETDGRVFASYQAHSLELLEQVPAFEDSLTLDVHPPIPYGFSSVWCRARCCRVQVQVRFGLVEVPPHGGPQHHGDLTSRGGDGLEFAGGWVDDVGDVEAVAIQGGVGKAIEVLVVILSSREAILGACSASFFGGLPSSFLTVDDNRPTWWEGGVVSARVVGFKRDPAKHGRHGERQSIGEETGCVSHGVERDVCS